MGRPDTAVVEVTLRDCFCATELEGLERALSGLPGVLSAHLDRTRSVAHLRYDPARTGADELRERVHRLGYRCECAESADSCCQPGHPSVGTGDAATPAPAHDAHDAHAGHGGDMVADMLRRFVVSAVLTVPIVLFSPIGESIGWTVAPPFGLSMGWFGLILTTPVVFWGGWPFLSAAWRAARHGEANMMTLIATGILVSYVYSLVATVGGGTDDVFFEAAAMLTTFSLAGHWLEMRSRYATGRAVEALLALAPPTAQVRRDGTETQIPLDQVVVG